MDFEAILNEINKEENKSLELIDEFLNNRFDEHLTQLKESYMRDNSLDINLDNWDNSSKEVYIQNIIDFYTKSLKKLNKLLNNIESETFDIDELNRIIIESANDICNDKIETIIHQYQDTPEILQFYLYKNPFNLANHNNKFSYYPALLDGVNFTEKLVKKKEFFLNQNDSPKKTRNIPVRFRKSSVQKFVKNYISTDTPYNGILLWHEVGVGKTCAAIGIAENFKSKIFTDKQKTLILIPGTTLAESWYDEIFNIKKELDNPRNNFNKQCTGDSYTKLNIINPNKKANYSKIKRKRDKIIRKKYTITGYQSFANTFLTNLNEYLDNIKFNLRKFKQRNLIKFIKQNYSNRVIILDEVHFTREDNTNTKKNLETKSIRKCLSLIARYGIGNKWVLLSATPMFDKAPEIIWLINLLRLNDKRALLKVKDYFDGDKIISSKIGLFENNIRGYISYQRGEDPFVFPAELYPSVENIYDRQNLYIPDNEDCLIRAGIMDVKQLLKNTVYKKIIGSKTNHISEKYKDEIKDLVIYRSYMSTWQYEKYKEFTNNPDNKLGYNVKPRQFANMIFPSIDDGGTISENPIFDKNFKTLFKKQKNRKIKIHEALVEEGKSILHLSRIGKYSKKIENILNIIDKSEGIVFVYSQFLDYGAKLLAYCLEENGFNRFNCNSKGIVIKDSNLLEHTQSKKSKKSYILLAGNTNSLSINKSVLNKLKDHCNSYENKDGKKIKVIIGTSVVAQGISFFNIRQIHILEPWYNMNNKKQITGRGIRRFSHKMLEEPKRNVTVYLHASVAPKNYKPKNSDESIKLIDEHMYSLSLKKYKNILEIYRIMKQSSVDCNVNKKGNIYNTLEGNIEIIDSFGIKRSIPLRDFENSMKCEYTTCDYKCKDNINIDSIKISELDNDTYNNNLIQEQIITCKEEIKNIFLKVIGIDFNNLKQQLKVKINFSADEEDNIIKKSLRSIIANKDKLYNKIVGSYGLLEKLSRNHKGGKEYYIFQTYDSNYIETLSSNYLPKVKIKSSIPITNIKVVKPKYKKVNKTIDNLCDLLLISIFNTLLTYWQDAVPILMEQGMCEGEDNRERKILENISKQFKKTVSFNKREGGELFLKHQQDDGTSQTKFGYDTAGIFDFKKSPAKTSFMELIKARRKKIFDYEFNNGKVTVNKNDNLEMAEIVKHKQGSIKLKYYNTSLGEEKLLFNKSTSAIKSSVAGVLYKDSDINQFYSGKISPYLPNIYDIIYNQFLTYIENKPLEMRNEDLKNILNEIYNKSIKDLLDPFFFLNKTDKDLKLDKKNPNKSPPLRHRIDFININDETTLKKEVISIIFYSYFSSRSLDKDSIGISETHPFNKFSYFLTEKMYKDTRGESSDSIDNNKIKYLLIPTSSKPKPKKKGKKVHGRIGQDYFDIFTRKNIDEPSERAVPINAKNLNSNFFPDISEEPLKSLIFGFTSFNNMKSSFKIVNKDPKLDSSNQIVKTKKGKKSKKTNRTGAICGHGLGCKDKPDLGKLINELITRLIKNPIGDINLYKKYGPQMKKRWPSIPQTNDLCMELKCLLRHIDQLGYENNSVSPRVPLNKNKRYFYHEHIKQKIDRTIENIK